MKIILIFIGLMLCGCSSHKVLSEQNEIWVEVFRNKSGVPEKELFHCKNNSLPVCTKVEFKK